MTQILARHESRKYSLTWWIVQMAAGLFMAGGLAVLIVRLGWPVAVAVLLVLWGNNLELKNRKRR